ncbi:MAG: efflux RND transporter permease subunit [Acidobacteria bacterium]|nr:MAG: efflux RND transporter permease subunit [Acidobacteriota bacterium]
MTDPSSAFRGAEVARMAGLPRLATRRPVAVVVCAVGVALLGVQAWRRLPVDLLPDIRSPTVVVSVRSGDRPPLEMERLYGERIEQRLFAVRGLRDVSQVARTGRLVATVTFDWDVDMDAALIEVQRALSPLAADPEVDELVVRRFDPRQAPVLTIGLLAPSGRPDLAELRRLARRQLAPALERLAGVAEARVLGGRVREIQVRLDRARLDGYGLDIGTVAAQLAAANRDVNAGTLEEGGRVYVVRGVSRFRSVEDVRRAVIAHRREGGRIVPVRVADVGEVVEADAEIRHLVRVNGSEGVSVAVYKEAGANTVAVSRTVRRALAHLRDGMPGVAFDVVTDEASLVEGAIGDLEWAAIAGILLAVGVLVLFLRSAGPTVVVAAAVPVSLLAAVLAMHVAGRTLNIVTLAGLALGAGMLVDNAIVVVEAIFRRLTAGREPRAAAAEGAEEVSGAIAASTFTTCVVFVPVLFMRGLASRLVAGLAFTVVAALLASLLAALALIPALAVWLLPRRAPAVIDPGRSRVRGAVAALLRRSGSVTLASALVAAGGVWALASLGTELLAPADPRQFAVRLVGPPGTRVRATERAVAAVEELLRAAASPAELHLLAEVGRLPEDDRLIREEQTEENTARVFVRLGPGGPTASETVARASAAASALTGWTFSWEVGASALARAIGTAGPPIRVELSGRSPETLREAASAVREALAGRPELWNVRSSFEGGPPELVVRLDRPLSDGLGIDVDGVVRALRASLDGLPATTLTTGDEDREIVLRLPRVGAERLAALPVRGEAGTRVALGQIARLQLREGAREIFRRDQRRVAEVTARLARGVRYPAAAEAARRALGSVELPLGVRARLAGEETERRRTFEQLAAAGALALILVFMVLAGSFESLLHPITVLAAVPLALAGVAAVLLPVGEPIGVMAGLGLIVLAGVAVNDAILLVDAARRLRAAGADRRDALSRAAALRLRPILMTTATTVLALVPLALVPGEEAELRRPLALTVIGGILASTAGSLFVVPCLYDVLDRIRRRERAP